MSRILRHVGANDLKRTRQRLVDEQRILSEKNRREQIREQKEKEEIAKLSAPFKSSWKADLFPEEVEVKETIEVVKEKKVKISEKWKYDWRKSFDEKPEKELVEKVFEPITFIKNKKISDSIFDTFSNVSNWREELIDEGMSSKDFPDLYGYGISIFDVPITSTIQNPVQSTLAQDIVNASAETTDYAFGPQFPGSYVNQVGGVESLSKVDAQAALGDLEDEPRNTLKRAYYSDGDNTWDGSYQGPSLPTDPWNNNPTEITGTEGQDYQQVLDVRVNHGENRIATHSIRLEAGQEYDFRILKYANGRVLPAGVTYSPGSQAYFQGGTEVSISSDSVLSLQDENGALVAFNDDEFATFYNQTIGPAEYGYAIQPQPSFFPDDGTLDLVPQYTGGDVEEFVPGIDIWSQSNTVQWDAFEDGGSNTQANFTFDSRITYTPTTTGTYYLALRDYRDRGSDIQYVRLRVSGRVPAAAQAAVADPRSQAQRTTDAADLGAPVAAFDPNRKDRKRDGNPDSLQLDPEIEKIDTSITDPQERNLIDKAKDAVLDFAADIIGARSAKNALDSYNKFLANPKGPGSTPDKPLDITNNFTKKDIGILRSAVANDAYSKDKIRQAIESSGKSQHIQDLRWEVAIGAVETAIRDASSKSEGLNNSIHGGGTLDREAFIRSGGKEITFIKPYGFRPGGSVAQFEKSPFGRLMNATGLPADTIGAGGNPAVVVGGVIASQLMLNNAKRHGGIYKAPTAYMKVNISSGTMKESTNFDYEGKPSPNGFPDTPPPQMINGYHPDYGKKGDMYNRLDPHSAASMPKTGDGEIDAKVAKVKSALAKLKRNR